MEPGERESVRGTTIGTFFAGVEGHSTAAAGGTGVLGQADGTNGTGVRAVANDGSDAKAVYGSSSSGHAGFFDGRVRVVSAGSAIDDIFVDSGGEQLARGLPLEARRWLERH